MMKHKYILISFIITCLILSIFNNTNGYVLQCPGTQHFNTYQNMTFSDCVNSSYFEFGPDYFWLSDMNFTIESLSSHFCTYNLSFFNDTYNNHTTSEMPYRFFEFNATYTGVGNHDFIMDINTEYPILDMYVNDVLEVDDLNVTSGDYDFSYDFTGVSEKYTFYVDGYYPECPGNGSSSYNTTGYTVNLTWSAALRADSYVVIRNNNSYPTTPTDGTEVQNSSLTYYNTSITSIGYFSVWSYNNSGRYSPDSCKLDIPWGGLEVDVYKENEPHIEITNYDVFIKNADGSEVYQALDQNNPFVIDVLQVPNGEDIAIQISADGYKTRTRYMDLLDNYWYNVSFYLPPDKEGSDEKDEDDPDYIPDEDEETTLVTNISTVVDHNTDETIILSCQPSSISSVNVYNTTSGYWDSVADSDYSYAGSVLTVDESAVNTHTNQIRIYYYCGNNETYAEHYILRVIDETNTPVDDCLISIKKYINTTDSYETIYSMYTDSYGEQSADLIPGTFYIVMLNHSTGDYQNESHDWQPPEINYVEDTIKVFILEYAEDEQPPVESIDEYVTFTIENEGNTLYINFSCTYPSVEDAQVYVYEENSSTSTSALYASYSYTDQDSFNIALTVNTSNSYMVQLFYNHTYFSHLHQMLKWFKTIDFEDWEKPTSPTEIDTILTVILGTNPFLWGNFIVWIFVIVMFFYIDSKESGKFLVFIGGILLFLDVIIGFISIALILPLLMIFIGILVIWRNSNKQRG